ncbi:MAG: hypothetical protein AB1489_29635 [Acidobacteriota bacterium]
MSKAESLAAATPYRHVLGLGERQRVLIRRAVLALLGLLLCYFGWLASELTIHYYDSYQYLNSAKALVGFNSSYDYTRPPLLPLLLTPLLFAYRALLSPFWLERAPYFLMLIINAAALCYVWRVWCAGLGRELAWPLLLLLLLNRVVFHYLPFVMPDILAMGIVAGLALSCERLVRTDRVKEAAWVGWWLGLAVSTKHYLAPLSLVPVIFLLLEWVRWEEQRVRVHIQLKQLGWLAIIAVVAALVFLSLHKLVFGLVPEYQDQSVFVLIQRVVVAGRDINGLGAVNNFSESVYYTFELLIRSFSLPLLLVGLLGMILAIKCWDRWSRLLIIIFVIHLTVMTVLLLHREARYFLQIYPVIYFFIGLALKRSIELWSRSGVAVRGYYMSIVGVAITLSLLVSVLYGTATEVKSFTDSCYRDDLIIRLGRYLNRELAPHQKAVWLGGYHNLLPTNTQFIDGSRFYGEFYYTYSAHANAVAYYSDRRCYGLYPFPPSPARSGRLARGDLIILAPDFPPQLAAKQPFRIYLFEELKEFRREGSQGDTVSFVEPASGGRILLLADAGKFRIQDNSRQQLLLWELALGNQTNLFMNALPLPLEKFTTPVPVAIKDIDKLLMIPLVTPPHLFYGN